MKALAKGSTFGSLTRHVVTMSRILRIESESKVNISMGILWRTYVT
jgi:hypothetical protein